MVTALAIAGSHAGWIVFVCVRVCNLTNNEGGTSARGAFVRWTVTVTIPNPICLLVRSYGTECAPLPGTGERGFERP